MNNKTQNKINVYLAVFAAFVIITVAVFAAFRYGTQHDETKLSEPAESGKVIVKKDDNIAVEKEKLLKEIKGDNYMGNEHSPVLMIEYASLSCPHCADFHEKVVEPMMPSYIKTGKVKYVFRDFPTNISALSGSKTAHCADPAKYFSFLKVLFKSQEQWAFNENYESLLKSIAKLGGVTEDKFEQCMKDKDLESKIFKSVEDAKNILGVDSTPTIFINGTEYKGKHNYDDVAAVIDELLKGEETNKVPSEPTSPAASN